MKNLAVQNSDGANGLAALSPITLYPLVPSVWKEFSDHTEIRKGRSLMPNSVLESKVHCLETAVKDLEASVPYDEDVDWYLSCIKDHLKSLYEIANDYQHPRDYA